MALRSRLRRPLLVGTAAVAATLMGAAPALAHQCVNASKKNQSAGVQVVIDVNTEEIVWMSKGAAGRFERGVLSEDNFHGLLGLDFDGDGAADVATWLVTPTGEIPLKAQYNGPMCKGVVHISQWMGCQTAPV